MSEEWQKHYVKLVHDRLDQKYSFVDAMVYGYKSILSSTHFLFLQEPGSAQLTAKKDFQSTRLDDYAVANRLAGPTGLTEKRTAFNEPELVMAWAESARQGLPADKLRRIASRFLDLDIPFGHQKRGPRKIVRFFGDFIR